jgi:hypothetical protein
MDTCSHEWIDPTEAPIDRAPYSPVIGPGRREMKRGKTYRCQRCGETLQVPTKCVLCGHEGDGEICEQCRLAPIPNSIGG